MAKTKEKKTSTVGLDIERDSMMDSLLEVVNKTSKSGGNAAFYLDAEDDPSMITDWISTGNSELDLAISNRKNGGLPVGRIVELNGLEAAGKSLIAAHVLAETQKKGGLAIFYDTETAVSKEFMEAIGIDVSKLLYINFDTIEDIFESMENMITKIRNSDKKRLVTIVVDSVAAATCKEEMDQGFGKEGYGTMKALLLSKAMRKITNLLGKQRILLLFTNQLRQKVGFVGVGDQYTTSGGKAIAFHASVRVRLKSVGRINNADKEVIGMKTQAVVIKNRMGPPFKKTEFNIFFDRGIDNYGNWLERLTESEVIFNYKVSTVDENGKKKTKDQLAKEREENKKSKNLQFDMVDADGNLIENVKFEKKDFLKLLEDRPEVKEYLYDKLCENFIFKYSNKSNDDRTDIEISSSGDGMDD